MASTVKRSISVEIEYGGRVYDADVDFLTTTDESYGADADGLRGTDEEFIDEVEITGLKMSGELFDSRWIGDELKGMITDKAISEYYRTR